MNPVDNPFSPGAGTPPAVLAGRADILAAARDAIASLVLAKPLARSFSPVTGAWVRPCF